MIYHKILLSIITSMLLSLSAIAGDLVVTIENIRNNDGKLLGAVWNKAEGFPESEAAVAQAIVPATKGVAKMVFPNLKPGKYAFSIFHDEDEDGELNFNFLGMPTEAYGFSKNARGAFGPPKFDRSTINVGIDTTHTTIKIE